MEMARRHRGSQTMQITEVGVPGLDPSLYQRSITKDILSEASNTAAAELDAWKKPLAYEKLGTLYRLSGQPQAAVRAFEEAIRAHGSKNSPAVTRVFIPLGLTLREMGRWRQALDAWEQGIGLLFDRALKIIHGEGTLLRSTRVDNARMLLADRRVFIRIRELCRIEPTFAILRNNMGVVLADAGELQQAVRMFQESIDFTPEGFQYGHPIFNMALLSEHGSA
jgi:tetratricopeptide (TPR) repeat protein